MEVITLSLETTIWICLAIFSASLITSVTGMAGGVLMFSAMSQSMPLRPLIAIHGVIQIFSNAARCWFLAKHIRWSMCGTFSLGAIVGSAATTVFLVNYVSEFMALSLLLILIIYTLFRPKKIPQIFLSNGQFFGVGLITGAMGIVAGAIDPLLAVFFVRDDLSKEQVVATKSFMQLVTHLCKIPAFIYLGFSFMDNLPLILLLSTVAILGTQVGVRLLAVINSQTFFSLMKIALFISGAHISYQLLLAL